MQCSQNQDRVNSWVKENPFTPSDVDCATAVMLKILDGKCKMKPTEKIVMTHLYEAVKQQAGLKLGQDIHQLITANKNHRNEEMIEHIYEKRVLAETMISRPIMKKFKAGIRQNGLFQVVEDIEAVMGATTID